jgi:hypothetical protein
MSPIGYIQGLKVWARQESYRRSTRRQIAPRGPESRVADITLQKRYKQNICLEVDLMVQRLKRSFEGIEFEVQKSSRAQKA